MKASNESVNRAYQEEKAKWSELSKRIAPSDGPIPPMANAPDERDCQIAELVDLVEHLSTFLHPGTSVSEPGDQEALDRADAAIERYRPAT